VACSPTLARCRSKVRCVSYPVSHVRDQGAMCSSLVAGGAKGRQRWHASSPVEPGSRRINTHLVIQPLMRIHRTLTAQRGQYVWNETLSHNVFNGPAYSGSRAPGLLISHISPVVSEVGAVGLSEDDKHTSVRLSAAVCCCPTRIAACSVGSRTGLNPQEITCLHIRGIRRATHTP